MDDNKNTQSQNPTNLTSGPPQGAEPLNQTPVTNPTPNPTGGPATYHDDVPPPPPPFSNPAQNVPQSTGNWVPPKVSEEEVTPPKVSEPLSGSTGPIQKPEKKPSDETLLTSEPQQTVPGGKVGRAKLIASIVALVLLVVSIPSGILLVQRTQRSQDIREQAFAPSECDEYGGFKEYSEACDCGRMQPNGELLKIAVCNSGKTFPLEPTGRECAANTCSGGGGQTQCTGPDGKKYNPGDKRYDCTGNKASCRGEAGEGIPQVCNSDGNWSANPSECTNQCPVADKSDCEYRENCKTSDGKDGTKLCSGTKDSAGVCKYNPAVSSCGACSATPIQSCKYNRNYQEGLLADKPNPDPNCGTNGGIYCNDGGTKNVCCYSDGNCYEGQQGSCKDLGNGTIQISQTAVINEYYCPDHDSAKGSCSSNIRSLDKKGPGTYTVSMDRGCGGYQIDAVGLCGSYTFKGGCEGGGPTTSTQCLEIFFYDMNDNKITDPAKQIKAGDKIRIAVSGRTNEPGGLTKAQFRINGGAWEESSKKNTKGEFYLEKTITAGPFGVEAQVYNPNHGWK